MNLNNFLVYIETDDNGLVTANSFEALNAAKQAAKVKDAAVSVLVIGDDVSKAVEEMRFHGIEKIFIKQGGDFKNYRPRNFLAVFEKIYQLLKPGLALFCNSKNSLDLAARAAVYLDAALITDCVEIKWEDEELFFTKPIYSNNVMAVYSTGDFPCIATLRSKSFSPSERLENQKGEIIDAGPINAPALDEYEVIEKCFIKDGEKKLADADIIVAGGRGIGGPEGFIELKKLADMLRTYRGIPSAVRSGLGCSFRTGRHNGRHCLSIRIFGSRFVRIFSAHGRHERLKNNYRSQFGSQSQYF